MSFASVFRKIFYKSKKSRFTTRFPAWCRSQNCMPKILRMVAEAGFEPAISWLWAMRDSGFLYSAIKTSHGTHCKEACEVLLKSFSVATLNRGFTIVCVGNYSTPIIANQWQLAFLFYCAPQVGITLCSSEENFSKPVLSALTEQDEQPKPYRTRF